MTKHSGINATRDVLRRELARAADEIIERGAELEIYKILHKAAADRQTAWLSEPSPWPIRIACVIGFAIGLFVGVAL